MTSSLAAGDKNTALTYLNGKSRSVYNSVFDALMPEMTSIFAEFSTIVPISIANNTADYAIIRLENGQIQTFIINFIKDDSGVWHIDSM